MKQVMISYAHKDQDYANKIVSILEQNNIKCWIDYRDIHPGVEYSQSISKAIKSSDYVVVIVSANSIKSEHVTNELNLATNHDIPLIPFKIDNAELNDSMEYYLGRTHWLEAVTLPIEPHIKRLVGVIKDGKSALKPTVSSSNLNGKTLKKRLKKYLIIFLIFAIFSASLVYFSEDILSMLGFAPHKAPLDINPTEQTIEKEDTTDTVEYEEDFNEHFPYDNVQEQTSPSTTTEELDSPSYSWPTENDNPDQTQTSAPTIETEKTIDKNKENTSRQTAKSITPGAVEAGYFDIGESRWYKFKTNSNGAAYRIIATPKPNSGEFLSYSRLYLSLYNNIGMKLDEVYTRSESDAKFMDLYLEPNTEYFVKIHDNETGYSAGRGPYDLCITELICDAGKDIAHATPITLGTMVTATIDSTLSDWYVLTPSENIKCKITLHNIDTKSTLGFYCTDADNRSSYGSNFARNENNASSYVYLDANKPYYFEVRTYNSDDRVANGNYIIVVEPYN